MAHSFPLLPPVWVLVVIIFRDLVILGGLVLFYMMGRNLRIRPNLLGKLTTTAQMATLISILLLLPISPILWYATAFLTIASGFTYVIREMKEFRR